MSGYRPITDTWILGRPKVKYYGAYPSGFLARARALLGVNHEDSVLHVCGGRVRDYPFEGFGPNDKTLDLDPSLDPDYRVDARRIGESIDGQPTVLIAGFSSASWAAILVDRPYTPQDAEHYGPGPEKLPEPNDLLRRCLSIVRPGGRVGWLDYVVPHPPRDTKFVALVAVSCGFNNRIRAYSVFEREAPGAKERKARALRAVRGQ